MTGAAVPSEPAGARPVDAGVVGDDDLGGWALVLAPRVLDLVRAYLPGAPIDARRRELLAAVTAAAAGCEPLVALHATWHDLLGPAELHEVDDDVLAWAVAAVAGGPGLSPQLLPEGLPPAARRAIVALVAHTAASSAALGAAASVLDRVRGRVPARAGSLLGHLATGLAGVPLVVPTAAAGAVVSAVGRLVPGPVTVEVAPDPNLLAQLLAETLPTWFGGAWGRTLVAAVPVEVPVAVRAGLTGATVRIGAGRVRVANGVAPDAWAVFDGEVDALVRAGSQSLTRELRAARLSR